MNFAEKLTTIAENEQRVYEAGKQAERSKVEGEIKALESEVAVLTGQKQTLEAEKQELQQQYNDLSKRYYDKVDEVQYLEGEIAKKQSQIDSLNVRITELNTELLVKYQEGYDSGVRNENERYWKTIQTKLAWYSGTGWVEVPRTSYIYAFRQWYTAKEINPLYPIEADGVTQMFESCQCITKHPPITFLQPLSTYAMFNGCRELKEAIGEFRLTGNCSAMFNACYALTKVNKLIIEGTVTWSSNAFAYCDKLVELVIEGTIDTAFSVSACVALNKASLTNIMSILSSTTSRLTCTFSKTAVNNAFETSTGAADGSTSTEWNTLVNSKPNWTILLV